MPLALVVDDADEARAKCVVILRELGFDVENLDDGNVALARLAAEPIPDLIVLDVVMPGTNGFVIRRFIHEDSRITHVPVVFMTGTPDVASTFKRLLFGSPVITKPVTEEALQLALARR